MTDQLLQLIATQAWQIAALAIVVAVVNRTVAKNRPHLAHALWMLVLIKCVTPPIWGHSLGLFSQLQAMWKADPVIRQDLSSDEPLLMPHHNTDDEIAHVPPADDPPLPGLIAMNDSEVASTSIVPISLPTRTANLSFVPEARPWKPSWPTILLSLVAIGAVLTITIMIVRCVLCLRHIQRHRTTEFDVSLSEQLHRLSKKLRLRRVPRIIVSDVLFGPAVIGLWRHVIVLPRCLIKAESPVEEHSRGGSKPGSNGEIAALRSHSPMPGRSSAPPLSTLDPILAHELLHIRRGDLRTGTLQAIVQSLWWFHPAVWLCNRWLTREAERCCDEQVIAELGCSPAQYARSLLSVIESKHKLQPIPVFPGMKPVEITSRRMERIMSLKSNLKKQTPLWCWLAVAVLAIVVLPGAAARTEADELKSSQTAANEPATKPAAQNRPKENFAAQSDSKPTVDAMIDMKEPFKKAVSLNLKDRSLFSTVTMLAEEHHFDINWSIPTNEKHLFRSLNYSCEQLPLGTALLEVVDKAGYRVTIDGGVIKINHQEHNASYVMPSAKRIADQSLDWVMNQIRWNEQLMLSPAQIPSGETVIVWVNEVPVRVRNIVSEELKPSGHQIVRAFYDRIGEYVVQEVLFQNSMWTEGDRAAIEQIYNKQFACKRTNIDPGELEIQWTERALCRDIACAVDVRAKMVEHLHSSDTGFTPQITQAVVQEAQSRILEAQLRTPVSLAVEDVDLLTAMKMIGSEFAVSFSVKPLQGEAETRLGSSRVTRNIRNKPLADLIREVIEPLGQVQLVTPLGVPIGFSLNPEEGFWTSEYAVQSPPGSPAERSVAFASKAVGDANENEGRMCSQLVTETREHVIRRLLSTDQHTPWQIMSGIEGLRRDMVLKNGDKTVNALEWIQAGPMYQGEPWFEKTEHGGRAHPYSKPYWFEGHVNQFLSKFAACQLPLHATFGTPDGPITIQDMINHAKMVVNDKEAVSWTLLALCHYLPPDAKWTNAKGDAWSIERLVDIEVGKHVGGPTSPNGGTDGLYALAVARNEYLLTGKPLEGVWLKADEKIKKYIDLAKSQQNPDGTLSSDFFRSSKRKDDFDKRLASSGHLLQFLIHAVSDEQLKEDWIRRAVETTASDIQVNGKEYVSCDPLFTATEALTTYLERTQGISLGLVASPLPMNVASRETSAIETVASSNDQLSKVLIGPVPKQNENGATLQKLPMPLTLVTYHVGDLVIPVNSGDKKPDYASITELIKATIEPDSWHDGAAIEVVRDTLTLVIRQTPRIHEQIKAFLQEVRKDAPQIQVSCRLMKLTTDEQLKGVEERCSMHPLNDHKSWALLTKSRSDEVIRFLTDKHTDVLMCPNITTYSGMTATIQIDPEETGDRWLRSLGFGSGTTTTLFRGCALGVEPRIIGDSSVIRLKHSVYLNLKSAAENHSGPLTGNEGTSPLSVDESLVSSGQTLLLLIDTTKVKTEDAALDSTSNQQPGSRGRYVLMLTVTRLEDEASESVSE